MNIGYALKKYSSSYGQGFLSLGVDVIIDEGLWHRFRRDDLRKIIASVGATAKLYHITCSEAVMKERVKKRNENLTDSFLIDENGFEDMKKTGGTFGGR